MKINTVTNPFYLISNYLFLWAMVVIPLYVENNYFNIVEAKGHVFLAGSIIALLLTALSVFFTKNYKVIIPNRNLLDWSIVSIALIAIISSFMSDNPTLAFTGVSGWWVGGFAIIAFSLFYLIMSKSIELNHNIWLVVIAVNTIVSIIVILHFMNIDVFRMHANAYPGQYYCYASTVGNMNWFVGYLCMIIPIFMFFYLECEDVKSGIIYACFMAILCMDIVLCGCDGIYLGIGVCSFFLIPYVFKDKTHVIRFAHILVFYGLSLFSLITLPCFAGRLADLEGLSARLADIRISILIIVFGIVIIILGGKYPEEIRKKRRAVVIILEAILSGVVIFFLINAVKSFDNSWGTNRGMTWTYSLELFRSFDIKTKLFGVGPEMLRDAYYGLQSYFDRPILVAHSDVIQILLTMGIVGLFAWCLTIGSIVLYQFKNRKSESLPYFFSIMAFIGQSLVNTSQAMNFALLCVIISLFSYYGIQKTDEQIQDN